MPRACNAIGKARNRPNSWSVGACGVLVAVVARSADGRLLGAVNRNAFDQRDGFAEATTVSPRLLPADAKLDRWTHLWTPNGPG